MGTGHSLGNGLGKGNPTPTPVSMAAWIHIIHTNQTVKEISPTWEVIFFFFLIIILFGERG